MRDQRPGGTQVIDRPAIFRVRPDHPFARVDASALSSLDHVISKVAHYAMTLVQPGVPDGVALSAVLVALFDGATGAEVVLTRRSLHLTNHQGQISFPGGRVDADEGIETAALREAFEEISLHPKNVEVIGQLAAASTYVSNSYIVPVVARLHAAPSLDAQNSEVDRVFSVPLIDLVRRDTYAEEFWGAPTNEHRLHFFYLDDETVWGATGRILYQLLSIALSN